jgi:hypothetical protein
MVPTEQKRIGVFPTTSVEEVADELLDLALMRSKGQGGDAMNSRVDELMQHLIESRVKYDPNVVLNGPLYAVQYQTGPVPSWEKFSQLSPTGKPNLKGQQYTLIESPGSSDTISPPTYQVVNYAELFGPGKAAIFVIHCFFITHESASHFKT